MTPRQVQVRCRLGLCFMLGTQQLQALEVGTTQPFELPDAGREVGLGLAAEPTPVASLYYAQDTKGLVLGLAHTSASLGWAPLTQSGYRLSIERWEPVLRVGAHWFEAGLGTALVRSEDANAHATGWQTALAAGWSRKGRVWQVGAQLGYTLGLLSHLEFSSRHRTLYAERYPDDRTTLGQEHANIWFGSHRARALAMLAAVFSRFSLRGEAGLQLSPAAGRDWGNLELGQLPLVLRLRAGVRF